MGRKKIEIKPLTDERNRNVTFLKRKAGLMKKAYELSVLCGVTVSLLIFNSAGKPFEFSSADFDTEIDRYNEYEGTIERRRGIEFAAGDDDDDDDEDDEGSRPPKGNSAAPKAGPSKSLKGKESFKARRVRWRTAGPNSGHPTLDGRDPRDRSHRRDSRDVKPAVEDDSFVGGLLGDRRSDSMEPPPRTDSPSQAGLSYALGLHSHHNPQQAWNAYRQGSGSSHMGNYPPPPFFPGQGGPMGSGPYANGLPNGAAAGIGNLPPSLPQGMGTPGSGPWENQMITTYAWLQIQQAHQEQKRQLLEKQQMQLFELTSRASQSNQQFLRDMLGNGSSSGASGAGSGAAAPGQGQAGPSSQPALSQHNQQWNEPFIWPTAQDDTQGSVTPSDDDLVWALSGAGAGASTAGGAGAAQHAGMPSGPAGPAGQQAMPIMPNGGGMNMQYAGGDYGFDGKRRMVDPRDDARKRARK